MKWLKRILSVFFVLSVLFLGTGVFLGYKYQDKAVPFVIEQINRYIITPVSVEKVELSFLERFPMANVKLSGVVAKSSNPQSEHDTLFALDQVHLSFNLLKLYRGEYLLNKVELHNGYVALHKAKNGEINYRFIADTDTVSTSAQFSIDLSDIRLKNVHVIYLDDVNLQDVRVRAEKFSAKGQLSNNTQSFALYGLGLIEQLKVGEDEYIKQERIFLDAGLELDNENSYYQISRGKLKLRENYGLDITGTFGKETWQLKALANNIDLEALPAMLPAYISQPIADLRGSGKLHAEIDLQKTAPTQPVSIHSYFEIREGTVHLSALNAPVKTLNANVTYTNGKEHSIKSSALKIDSLSCSIEESTLSGKADIRNFEAPVFRAKGTTHIAAGSLLENFGADSLGKLSGSATAHFELSGKVPLNDTNLAESLLHLTKEIDVHSSGLAFSSANGSFEVDSIVVHLKDNHLAVEHFTGNVDGTRVRASGIAHNALTYLMKGAVPAHAKGELHIGTYRAQSDTSTGRLAIPQGFDYNLNVRVDSIIYKDFVATGLTSNITLNKSLYLNNFSTRTLGGTLSGDIAMHPYANGMVTQLKVRGTSLLIRDVFETFNDFEQSAISYTHLKGKADVDAAFKFTRDLTGNTVPQSIEGKANLTITEGELIDYEPLYSLVSDFRKNKVLSLFIKLEEFENRLKHIRFDTLTNSISIANQTVFIPQMTIRSNALDLSLSGKQTFDNQLDYHLGFNLKQVLLANRDQPLETEYGYIEDDGTGNRMVYLNLTGTADNPIVKFDKQAAKARRKEVVQQEVNTTKAILNEEFGLFKSDSLTPAPDQKTTETPGIDLEGFDASLEETKSDSTSTPVKPAADSSKQESKWKKLLQKVSGEESKSKFENWEFEENDDW